jgi:hypothetical protein
MALTGLGAITQAAKLKHPLVYQDGKIVHPTTAMGTDEVNAILKKMQGKANDAEKVAFFKRRTER